MAHNFIDLFLHLDKYLNGMIQNYGVWTYLILFLIVFFETGLVITPILPGDSLLFTAGALSATAGGPLHAGWLSVLLSVAAVAGDTVNYWIGHVFGDELAKKYPLVLKKEYLDKTHAFYERYGGETIIIARFVPIVRTFAPFVAGVGRMTYLKFISYNVIGGVLWIAAFIFGGYFFGNTPVVKSNFGLVILVIIILSILPGVIEFVRHGREDKKDLVFAISTKTSVADELARLAQLAKDGLLSPDEWTRAKELFLGKSPDKRDDVFNALQRLHELHKSGALSQSEFNMKKWDILSRTDV